MIRILNTIQIRALDQYTIQHEPVASIDLMERACKAFCSWFTDEIDPSETVGIICGTGNNGGDGLGIARLLAGWDYTVKVWIVRGGAPESEDFALNLNRLPERIVPVESSSSVNEDAFNDCTVLVDALFGTGLSRSVEGIYQQVIECLNRSQALRIAVDIPSGLLADAPSSGSILRANHTVTFHAPKLAFLLAENVEYVGEWHVVDIGLSREGATAMETENFMLTRKSISRLIKPLHKFDHKGIRGKALLIAGSYGKMGAAVLAARGALRTGTGSLTVHVPQSGYTILQSAVPEAMVSVDPSYACFTGAPLLQAFDAVGIGPGLGQDPDTLKALRTMLENCNDAVVLDADALNLIAANRELLHIIPPQSILTPHPGEFARLAGEWTNDFEKLEMQRAFAKAHQVNVVLKGAYTSIATSDGTICFNNTGNPGMATGGMGDLLTGILTALLAQGYEPAEAARLGVWLHGMAGDAVARQQGMRGMTASDLIVQLNDCFRQLT